MSLPDEFKLTFFEECTELLADLEENFEHIEAGDYAPERIQSVFRAIHSIKGGASAFGFEVLIHFAHSFEALLDHIRTDMLPLNPDIIVLCIRAIDIVADLIEAAKTDAIVPENFGAIERAAFEAYSAQAQLSRTSGINGLNDMSALDTSSQDDDDFLGINFQPIAVDLSTLHSQAHDLDTMGINTSTPTTYEIYFSPDDQFYRENFDPLPFFYVLQNLGDLSSTVKIRDLPNIANFDPTQSYCEWKITLTCPHECRAEIEDLFASVAPYALITINGTFPFTAPSSPPKTSPHIPSEMALDDIELDPKPSPSNVSPLPLQSLDISPQNAQTATVEAIQPRSVRVDLEKVDRVVNMVGELVINHSMLMQQIDDKIRDNYPELIRGLEILSQTTRGLQDSVMAIRAQPVKSVFARMPRLVRELGGKTGKQLRLITSGEHTEIDKSVIEQLIDPLTHMVRNSIDHGIEAPSTREALGKHPTGTIHISAKQSGGTIVIIVEDDGGGINRENVLAKARKIGMVSETQILTDEQIDHLLFEPGFSTTSNVTDISGRGVGMNVVLENIQKMGGVVDVWSQRDVGTRITLRLPLTLAVLDVMQVRVGAAPYVIALSSILESLQTSQVVFGHMPSGAPVLNNRGEYIQIVDLSKRFQLHSTTPHSQKFVIICEADQRRKIGLVVDDIIGQQQVVIKSLEDNFHRIPGVSGGTILGDGSIALILDIQELAEVMSSYEAA